MVKNGLDIYFANKIKNPRELRKEKRRIGQKSNEIGSLE